MLQLGGAALLALVMAGCAEDRKDGAPGAPADPAVLQSIQDQISALTLTPETCVVCHTGSEPVARTGPLHQATYKEFYQDAVVQVVAGSMNFAITTVTNPNDTTVLTFQLTKKNAAGTPQPFDCRLGLC